MSQPLHGLDHKSQLNVSLGSDQANRLNDDEIIKDNSKQQFVQFCSENNNQTIVECNLEKNKAENKKLEMDKTTELIIEEKANNSNDEKTDDLLLTNRHSIGGISQFPVIPEEEQEDNMNGMMISKKQEDDVKSLNEKSIDSNKIENGKVNHELNFELVKVNVEELRNDGDGIEEAMGE